MMTFELEHAIVAKLKRMDELVARHNHLVSLVPKVLTQDVIPEMQLTMAEVESNEKELLAVMAELENLCGKSPFFQRQQTTKVSVSDTKAQQ
jgi:hypothetical protein